MSAKITMVRSVTRDGQIRRLLSSRRGANRMKLRARVLPTFKHAVAFPARLAIPSIAPFQSPRSYLTYICHRRLPHGGQSPILTDTYRTSQRHQDSKFLHIGNAFGAQREQISGLLCTDLCHGAPSAQVCLASFTFVLK